jgi:membrane-associated protein
METLKQLIHDYIIHFDVTQVDAKLKWFIDAYGPSWMYAILFVVIFCETGLVVTPFLPGDSLLFLVGTFAGRRSPDAAAPLDFAALFTFLSLAAILGDTVNYWMGHAIGPRAFKDRSRFFRKEYLERTHKFFERHGGKTIIIARFIPIIRTFAPFVAGIGAMNYRRFIIYNVVGGMAWVGLFLGLGCWFGTRQFVRDHFHLVTAAIILISVAPILIEYLRTRKSRKRKIRDQHV